MALLDNTLTQRVEDLIRSHHHEKILVETGAHTIALEALSRNRGLEQVVRELALEVEQLTARVSMLPRVADQPRADLRNGVGHVGNVSDRGHT